MFSKFMFSKILFEEYRRIKCLKLKKWLQTFKIDLHLLEFSSCVAKHTGRTNERSSSVVLCLFCWLVLVPLVRCAAASNSRGCVTWWQSGREHIVEGILWSRRANTASAAALRVLSLSFSLVLSVYLSLSARCIVGVLAFNLTAQFHWPAWETRTLARARATVVDSCAPLSFSLNYIRCIVLKLTRKTDLREDPFVVPLFMKRT